MSQSIPFPHIDPVAFSIFGLLEVRWYALAYLAGILLAGWLCWRLAKSYEAEHGIKPAQFVDFIGTATLGIVIGGRLGFIIFYQPGFYLSEPLQILNLRQGGMSFHGGMIGVFLVAYFYARNQKVPILRFGDCIAVGAPIGLFFGRVANFINAELWGRPADVPWAIVFPIPQSIQSLYPEVPRHPSQLYEAALEGVLLFIVVFVAYRIFSLRNRPGFVTGVFLLGYGMARFFVEFYREPDSFQSLTFGWMSYGQLYSLPLVLSGAVLICIALNKQPKPVSDE